MRNPNIIDLVSRSARKAYLALSLGLILSGFSGCGSSASATPTPQLLPIVPPNSGGDSPQTAEFFCDDPTTNDPQYGFKVNLYLDEKPRASLVRIAGLRGIEVDSDGNPLPQDGLERIDDFGPIPHHIELTQRDNGGIKEIDLSTCIADEASRLIINEHLNRCPDPNKQAYRPGIVAGRVIFNNKIRRN